MSQNVNQFISYNQPLRYINRHRCVAHWRRNAHHKSMVSIDLWTIFYTMSHILIFLEKKINFVWYSLLQLHATLHGASEKNEQIGYELSIRMSCILFGYERLRTLLNYLGISMVSVFIWVIMYLEGSSPIVCVSKFVSKNIT